MKPLFIYSMLLISAICFSQSGGYSSFESGTLEDWTNSDNSITNLSNEESGGIGLHYLKKQCDGTDTTSGEMAIKNSLWYQDNYMNGGASIINFYIKNTNSFDIHLRLGFTDFDNTKIILTTPIIVPQTSNWEFFNINIHPSIFTLIEGPNTIEDVLFGTSEMRFIHNEEISFNGTFENALFEIDDIGTVYLGINDFHYDSIKLFPNPTRDVIFVKAKNININRMEVFNLLGKRIKIQYDNFENINLTKLKSGVYLLKIHNSNNSVLIKKIVKN